MRKFNNIIKSAALCILAAMLSVSCLLEKDGPTAKMQGVMIEMSVSAPGMTKAEEDPTAAEKVINTLRVYAFYGDRLAGYASRQATSLGEPFYMDLQLPADGSHEVDFYLIANEAEMALENGVVQLSESMTKALLEEVRFTGLVHQAALPMYSKKTVAVNVDQVRESSNTADGHEGHFMLLTPIEFTLERSLAKLSVYAAKTAGAATAPEILSVDLLAQGTREYSYLFDQSDAVLDAVNPRSNNREFLTSGKVVVAAQVEKGSTEALEPANYTTVVDGVYMPEVREGLTSDDPAYQWNAFTGAAEDEDRAAVLYITYSLGEGQDVLPAYIYLPRVQRNHHIKFCILINAEGQIIINYTVADWDWDSDKMNNWFFDYPTHTNVWHRIPENEADLHTKPSSAATMSASTPFKGHFQMTGPASDEWTPTLEGLNASSCDIKVFNETTNAQVFDPEDPAPLPVSDDWYRIEVWPRAGYMTMGDKVNLAITYTPGGMTESEYLLINGSSGDYFWPESTSENYITITMVN